MSLFNLANSEKSPANLAQNSASTLTVPFTVHCEDRWQVHHRLQSLDIETQCKSFQPLQVKIDTPAEAIQLWSVVRQVSAPRHVLADSLDKSWQLKPFVRDC